MSLCDHSHAALYPWRDVGYTCTAVDIQENIKHGDGIEHVVCDVREYVMPCDTVFVMAWPPCTHLAVSGARWWKDKGDAALSLALELVKACVCVCVVSCRSFLRIQ